MSHAGDKKLALGVVDDFAGKKSLHAFRYMHRSKVAAGLRVRVEKPERIHQGRAGLCGPASILYSLALHDPIAYVELVIDLFERGRAKLGEWKLRPSYDLLHHNLGEHAKIREVDWIPMASIRDCENWFFDYSSPNDRGGTSYHEMEDMYRKAGYAHVVSDNNLFFTTDEAMLLKADRLRRRKYRVCMRINADLLKDKSSTWSLKSNHWVYLESPITQLGQGHRHLQVYTWGKYVNVEEPLDRILSHLYGYVACKW